MRKIKNYRRLLAKLASVLSCCLVFSRPLCWADAKKKEQTQILPPISSSSRDPQTFSIPWTCWKTFRSQVEDEIRAKNDTISQLSEVNMSLRKENISLQTERLQSRRKTGLIIITSMAAGFAAGVYVGSRF